jgi:hypothetical protein
MEGFESFALLQRISWNPLASLCKLSVISVPPPYPGFHRRLLNNWSSTPLPSALLSGDTFLAVYEVGPI